MESDKRWSKGGYSWTINRSTVEPSQSLQRRRATTSTLTKQPTRAVKVFKEQVKDHVYGSNRGGEGRQGTRRATKLFVERVTVAGLEDLSKARIRAEKCMWCSSYIIFTVMIIFTCYTIASERLSPRAVYDDSPVFGSQAPFPNITICVPSARNTSKMRDLLRVPKRVYDTAKKKNLSIEDIVERTLEIWQYGVKYVNYENDAISRAAFEVIDGTAPGSIFNVLVTVVPSCEDILSDCSFGGKPFECCAAARFVPFDGNICFHISLTHFAYLNTDPEIQGGSGIEDPSHYDTNGLSMNISIDWRMVTYNEDIADDGFLVFLGQLGTLLSSPTAIPFDSDAILLLAPPKKVNEISACRSNHSLPSFQYYNYYDPYGLYCGLNTLVLFTETLFGCGVSFFDYKPPNGTECSGELVYAISKMSLNDPATSDLDLSKAMTEYKLSDETKALVSQSIDTAHILRGTSSVCQPLCSRWTYGVHSASYGYVHYQGQEHWDRDRLENRSWTRLKINFPEATYHMHSEMNVNPLYLAVCDIGGVLGTYLGLSAITLMQLMVYGGYICYSRCRKH